VIAETHAFERGEAIAPAKPGVAERNTPEVRDDD
jgi:hypothetical protein